MIGGGNKKSIKHLVEMQKPGGSRLLHSSHPEGGSSSTGGVQSQDDDDDGDGGDGGDGVDDGDGGGVIISLRVHCVGNSTSHVFTSFPDIRSPCMVYVWYIPTKKTYLLFFYSFP